MPWPTPYPVAPTHGDEPGAGPLARTTVDPLLVRAGRRLVATPRALELREKVSLLVQEATAVLRSAELIDLQQLVRTFTLRTSDGFVENFGTALIARISHEAPGVQLRFLPKPDKDSFPLRDGPVVMAAGKPPSAPPSILN